MNPTPHKTPLERAAELDVAAKIAYDKQDYVFAQELAQHAHQITRRSAIRECRVVVVKRAVHHVANLDV